MKIIAMIVEDDRSDAARLQAMLTDIQPELTFLVFGDGTDALAYLTEKRAAHVDVFFIDRDLPKMDGFTLAEQIREIKNYVLAPIIFVTGYAMDQLDAFQNYHCYSYIVKPLEAENVRKRISPLIKNIGTDNNPKQVNRVIELKTEDGNRWLCAQEILGVEVMGRVCFVHTVKEHIALQRLPLDKVLRTIREPFCIRCHKSFAVNLTHVKAIKKERRNIWRPIFDCNTEFACEISTGYYESVIKQYKQCLSEKE